MLNPDLTSNYLTTLMKRGCEFLGCDYAILGGAMTWVSDAGLVAAISNAGGFGVLASGAMDQHQLASEIQDTQNRTQRPFGVNLVTLSPHFPNLLQTCCDMQISHVVLAGGIPASTAIKTLKDHNAQVICFTPTVKLGQRLVKLGADALIIEGSEAGGHIGPVTTSVLAQEIIPHISEVPIFVAGGIGSGSAMLAYLEMGAAGVQMGTRFVCAHESRAHPNFKKAFIKAASRHATVSQSIDKRLSVIPVRAINNQASREFKAFQLTMIQQIEQGDVTAQEAQLAVEHYWAGALRRAVIDGDVETGSLMAGQSIGLVTQEQSTVEIIQELVTQAQEMLQQRTAASA